LKRFFIKPFRVILCVIFTMSSFPLRTLYAQELLNLPEPGKLLHISPRYDPPTVRGIKLNPKDPFRFEFLMDTGDSNLSEADFAGETQKQIEYFLGGLTTPVNDIWVNLSPYEGNRIIPDQLGTTVLGRDLLAQDYVLKQLTASTIYPEGTLGKKFWQEIYKKTQEATGSTNVKLDYFNKVWIVPQKAVIYEKADTAYIIDSKLKVLLDEDYLAIQKHQNANNDVNKLGSQIVRRIVLPEIEKEINEGKNFAQLRQIYNSLILAYWFKKRFQDSFLGINYVDRNKVNGVDVEDKTVKNQIYQRYVKAYKRGVFNYIKEDYDSATQKLTPHKYFSGGIVVFGNEFLKAVRVVSQIPLETKKRPLRRVFWGVNPVVDNTTRAMVSKSPEPAINKQYLSLQNILSPEILKKVTNENVQDSPLMFVDPKNIAAGFQPLEPKMEELNNRFRNAVATLSKAGDVGSDEDIQTAHIKADMERMKVVKEWYEIGRMALAPTKNDNKDYRNYLVALIAFKKVGETQPMLRSTFSEVIQGAEFKPPLELLDNILTVEKAKEKLAHLPRGIHPEAYSQYVESIDRIKDAKQLYTDTLQGFLSVSEKKATLGVVAILNIMYDLGITDFELFRGINKKEGNSMDQLIDIALNLRELLFTTDPRITEGMKTQSAEMLTSLFSTYMLAAGKARKKIDLNGGISVPKRVFEIYEGKPKLGALQEAETLAFNTFLLEPSQGHSRTAMDWLANFYRKMSKYEYESYTGQALKLEAQKYRPQLTKFLGELTKLTTVSEMLDFYKTHFPQIRPEFLSGAKTGCVVNLPLRVEDSAGGIGDSSFLSIYRSHLYSILNHASYLTREDGTVGENVTVSFEIRDRKDLPKGKAVDGKNKKNETFLSVESLDVGFLETVTNSEEGIKKGDADLILQTLVSLGLMPVDLMKKAISENKQQEVMQGVFDHVLGQGKGLAITLHVKGISQGSGLAVSSAISMGAATAFDALIQAEGAKAVNAPVIKRVNNVVIYNVEDGSYELQLCKSEKFDDNVYAFPLRAVGGALEKEVFPEELPTGDGEYYVRYRKVEDKKWFNSQATNWVVKGQINLNQKISQASQENKFGDGSVKVFYSDQIFTMMDDEESIGRSIIASQMTVLRLSNKAGTQDEMPGLGGMVMLLAGDKIEGNVNGKDMKFSGSVVPKMMRVSIPAENQSKINHALRILRIGMSEAAEDTLNQVFESTLRNATREQQAAWAAISIEMMKAAQRGDVEAMGEWALRGVALRQKLAPVSIHPLVLRPMMIFLEKYGKSHGFRFGISGARSTGSVLVFFRPNVPEVEIQRIMRELEQAIKDSRDSVGRTGTRDDNPHMFTNTRIATRGVALRFLSPKEMSDFRIRVIDANREYKAAEREKNKKELVSYKPEEMAEYVTNYALDQDDQIRSSARYVENPNPYLDHNPLITVDEVVSKRAREIWEVNKSKDAQGKGSFSDENIKELKILAIETIKNKYMRFNAPGTHQAITDIVQHRLWENLEILQKSGVPIEVQNAFCQAVRDGKVDLLWQFNSPEQLKSVAETIAQGGSLETRAFENERRVFQEQLKQAAAKEVDMVFDGEGIFPKNFMRELDDEIRFKEKQLADLVAQSPMAEDKVKVEVEIEKLQVVIKMLKLAPDPQYFELGHFLFTFSDTYKKYYGNKLTELQRLMHEGGLVFFPLYGGMGARAFGGQVKGTVPFQVGNESIVNFLRYTLRAYSYFVNKFPSKRQMILNVLVSAFTEDAIKIALREAIKEEGLDSRTVTISRQEVREVVKPTEMELLFALALRTTSTEQERQELTRTYQWYVEKTEKALADQKGRFPKELERPVHEDVGLNPLNQFSPTGNAGPLEGIFHENSSVYTEDNLIQMGYKFNKERLEAFRKNPHGEEQLKKGMPLATASQLIEGDGFTVAVLQNGTGMIPFGGGDVNTARAVDSLLHPSDGSSPLAVVQYATNATGSDPGGILVKDRKTGAITTLESHRIQFAEGIIYEQGHSAIATGTVFINLKQVWKLLGYKSAEEYLQQTPHQIKQRVDDYMNNKWPKTFLLRSRKEETPGVTYEWPVLQQEIVLQWVLGWAQEQENIGLKGVKYQEVTPDVAFIDAKTRGHLYEVLARSNPADAYVPRVHLDEKQIKDVENGPFALSQREVEENSYDAEGFEVHKHALLAQGGMGLPEGRNVGVFKTGNSITLGQLENDLMRLSADLTRKEQNWYQMPESILLDKKQEVKKLLLASEDHFITSAKGLIQEFATVDDGISRTSAPLAVMIACDLLTGDDIDEVLSRYHVAPNGISNKKRLQIFQKVNEFKNAQGADDPRAAAYLYREFTALFDGLNDAYLYRTGKIKSFRTSAYRTTILTDKDATLEDPATPLKQASGDRAPSRAAQLFKLALRGTQVIIPTGSTSKEAWEQVFKIIKGVIDSSNEPLIAKKMAISRLKILPADASRMITLRYNDKYQLEPFHELAEKYIVTETGPQWVKGQTLIRFKNDGASDGKEVEDKTNRLVVWNSSVRSYLKWLFNEKQPWEALIQMTGGASDQGARESLQNFIDTLSLKEADILDFYNNPKAEEDFLDMQERISFALTKMLSNLPEAGRQGDHKRWVEAFSRILNNISNLEEKLKQKDGQHTPLTNEETLAAYIYLIGAKESSGTYFSVTGDYLEHARDKDDRISPIAELVINRNTWEQIKIRFSEDIRAALQAGVFVDQQGHPIEFAEPRAGPGYLNMVFGGFSKKNYFTGMLQDWRTFGHTVIAIGDSEKDAPEIEHKDRVLFRFLLGTTFELDSVKLERFISSGGIQTDWRRNLPNPFDPLSTERWGPSLVFDILSSIQRAMGLGRILEPAQTEKQRIEIRDRLLVDVVREMNLSSRFGKRPRGSINLPNSMRTLGGNPADNASLVDIKKQGGIAFENLDVEIKRDNKGVPLFHWQGQKMDFNRLFPVIYSISPPFNPRSLVMILASNGDFKDNQGSSLSVASLN